MMVYDISGYELALSHSVTSLFHLQSLFDLASQLKSYIALSFFEEQRQDMVWSQPGRLCMLK